jgi:hypothetical protein
MCCIAAGTVKWNWWKFRNYYEAREVSEGPGSHLPGALSSEERFLVSISLKINKFPSGAWRETADNKETRLLGDRGGKSEEN